MKILCVIVTHNRCLLLERCLKHVFTQSRLPDHVLVIDHESNDGTITMLSQRGIDYITQKNLGSSSGWWRGIEYALTHQFDAVWMMDDDGFPALDALSSLEDAFQPVFACVSSVVVQENDRDAFVFPFPVLDHQALPVLFSTKRKIKLLSELRVQAQENTYPFAHFFNGALISIAAIRSVGNVNRDFFIYGDEVDYFFRLRAYGPVISILDALHFHPNVATRPYSKLKIYYYLKNSLILNQQYFNWVWMRHLMTVVAILVRTYTRNGKRDFIQTVTSSFFYKALFRGLRLRLGNDFDT